MGNIIMLTLSALANTLGMVVADVFSDETKVILKGMYGSHHTAWKKGTGGSALYRLVGVAVLTDKAGHVTAWVKNPWIDLKYQKARLSFSLGCKSLVDFDGWSKPIVVWTKAVLPDGSPKESFCAGGILLPEGATLQECLLPWGKESKESSSKQFPALITKYYGEDAGAMLQGPADATGLDDI